MIFSLFGRGRLFEGGVYFKIRDFRGAFIRGGTFIRGNKVFKIMTIAELFIVVTSSPGQ